MRARACVCVCACALRVGGGHPPVRQQTTHTNSLFASFLHRFSAHLSQLVHKFGAKFGGATGGLCAHQIAYPGVDWVEWANTFLGRIGLTREKFTTQVSHYDSLATLCHCLSRVNVILLDLCKDVWQYISMKYFTQTVVKGEVGSSAMPHKVFMTPLRTSNLRRTRELCISTATTTLSLPMARLLRRLRTRTRT
jgi:adenylosuccinate lyase